MYKKTNETSEQKKAYKLIVETPDDVILALNKNRVDDKGRKAVKTRRDIEDLQEYLIEKADPLP